MYFALMDQGVGLFTTLNSSSKLKNWLIPPSKEELVFKAFKESMSSTKKKNRGLGLPKLRQYVEETAGGTINIHSHEVSCEFGNSPQQGKAWKEKYPLAGTLIVWKASGNDQGNMRNDCN